MQLFEQATGALVFGGTTDLSGELDLPKLVAGTAYTVRCTAQNGAPLQDCRNFVADDQAAVRTIAPVLTDAQNLRLFGHVALAGGDVCGHQNDFFGIRSAATVQLRLAGGATIGAPVHVNRFGDYQVSAAVPVRAALQLDVQCEGYSATLDVPASPDPAGYVASVPIELSHVIANARPQLVKMVANGADGNVRGQMVVPGDGTGSGVHPGADHYLTFKGVDTRLSACLYYRALGAVAGLRCARQSERRDLVLRLEDAERLRHRQRRRRRLHQPARPQPAAAHGRHPLGQRRHRLLRMQRPRPRRQVADRDRPGDRGRASTTRTRSPAWRWSTRR